MIIAIGIGLAGLFLIYLEFFVPGGILGILGGIAYATSLFLFVWAAKSTTLSLVYMILMILLLVATVKFALWKVKQKPALFAKGEQSGYLASTYDKELIGKEGTALTSLRPSGHILVEGERYQAVSESRFIKKGELVRITGGEGARYTVRRL
ncbi:NfeD family protein [Candidatus Neptunochlamydia vexilliferae]|uniref:NfeD-like C-terminal domain-containing protein n=1 Tax=Candidatus Neptunichlamydia vexilliferae TaxID=1651774 RepID=A0ABS0B0Y6_9BACT|nr:NfeD family protein [Candidatus Neptunochlamydia vexilliferae]MBF5060058.1 hypothetical protein [Candidatus Neptunochlamydia vexilliferae]